MATLYDLLQRRINNIIDRAIANRIEGSQVLLAQIESVEGTPIDGIELFQVCGFSSRPLPGFEAIVGNRGGNSSQALIILAGDVRYRIPIDEGESIIYNMPHGDFVHIKSDRSIHVKSQLKVLLETPLVECSSDLLVRGNATVMGNFGVMGTGHIIGAVTVDGDMSANGISLTYHHHREHDDYNTFGALA